MDTCPVCNAEVPASAIQGSQGPGVSWTGQGDAPEAPGDVVQEYAQCVECNTVLKRAEGESWAAAEGVRPHFF